MAIGAVTTGKSERIDLALDLLSKFGRLRLKVTGTSMLPGLLPGDVVELSGGGEAPAVGDLVLFRRGSGLVLHRVLASHDAGLLTQGDGLRRPDPPLAAAEVLGKVVGLTRRNRPLPLRRRSGWRLHAGRLLFGHSQLAARLFLRWRRFSARLAA
jgi:hypothetical protein